MCEISGQVNWRAGAIYSISKHDRSFPSWVMLGRILLLLLVLGGRRFVGLERTPFLLIFDTRSLLYGYRINSVQSRASISRVMRVLRRMYGTNENEKCDQKYSVSAPVIVHIGQVQLSDWLTSKFSTTYN